MKNKYRLVVSVLVIFNTLIAACGSSSTPIATQSPVVGVPVTEESATEEPVAVVNPGLALEAAKVAAQFFNDADYEQSLELISAHPLNPEAPIYLQYLIDNPVTIADYPQYTIFSQKEPPYNICFSDSGVENPWRVVGYIDMREQVEQLRADGYIKNFYHLDAHGDNTKQISDIQGIISTPGKCDILIIVPISGDALPSIIDEACEVMPVIQFGRSTQSDCPVITVQSTGNYTFGISSALFVVNILSEGGNVLVFRTQPNVDLLEQRWGAARKILEQNPQLNIIGVEFAGADDFKANAVLSDYQTKYGTIDAIWADTGSTAVTILKAFKEAGIPYPKAVVGEDQEDFLEYWKQNSLTAIATTFPAYQWRTVVLSALMFLQDETVQHHWILPQPDITSINLDQFVNPDMPPLHYALCGCEDMKNYPNAWKNPDVNAYVDVIP
jgi:ribose transport system substrate-binding protein